MYRMSVLAIFASATINVDVNKYIKMCLVHNLAESIIGNLTPADNIPRLEKNCRKSEVMDYTKTGLLGYVDTVQSLGRV